MNKWKLSPIFLFFCLLVFGMSPSVIYASEYWLYSTSSALINFATSTHTDIMLTNGYKKTSDDAGSWWTAKTFCEDKGQRLPTIWELVKFHTDIGHSQWNTDYGSGAGAKYWTSDVGITNDTYRAFYQSYANGSQIQYNSIASTTIASMNVICFREIKQDFEVLDSYDYGSSNDFISINESGSSGDDMQIASSTEIIVGNISYLLLIIIALMFLVCVAFIWNSLTDKKRKLWQR